MIGSTSWIRPVLKMTWLIGTSSVRSSIAATIASSFGQTTISFHRQLHEGEHESPFYTVVGHRKGASDRSLLE